MLFQPMENIVLRVVNGVPVRVKDVGSIEDSYEEQTELIRINGKNGLTLSVQKLASANSVQVVDNILAATKKMVGVPPSVKMSLTLDQSAYIKQSISSLQREAILGAVLAMVVIMIFLRNMKGTTIIFVAIPAFNSDYLYHVPFRKHYSEYYDLWRTCAGGREGLWTIQLWSWKQFRGTTMNAKRDRQRCRRL